MKKAVTIMFLSALVVTMLGIGIAKGNGPKPANIEKVTFVHYEKLNAQSKPVWDDTVEDFRLIVGGVKRTSTVTYEVNPTGSGLASKDVRSTLKAALETWDGETSFELFGSPTLTDETDIGYDEHNRVVWGELYPGIIAVNYLWYNPATKQIVESDIVFNTYYDWSTAGAGGAMDLQNIATHEFGHNGLGDLGPLKDWALTMYAYSDFGETYKRTLGVGDKLGIQTLYGAPSP